MKYQITNKNLSAVLEELAEEYKDLLIEATLSKSNEIDLQNISISDLTKIDIEIKEQLKNKNRNYKVNLISKFVSLLGLIYASIGLMLFLLSGSRGIFTSKEDNTLFSIAIVCVFVGFIIVILGMMTKVLLENKKRKIDKEKKVNFEIQIINTWRIVEGMIYQLSPQNDKLSLRTMLNNLVQTKIISKEDFKTINLLMQYRNDILHHSPGEIQYNEEIKTVLNDAQVLINKLSKISN